MAKEGPPSLAFDPAREAVRTTDAALRRTEFPPRLRRLRGQPGRGCLPVRRAHVVRGRDRRPARRDRRSHREQPSALLLGLQGGVAADRWNRRRTMIAADLVRAAVLLTAAVAGMAGELPLWALV